MNVVRDIRGITIVELMVVMALVATVLGIGAVSIQQISASDLRNESMRVAAVMRYTYSNAALNNSRYRLVFDLETGEYFTEVTDEALIETTNDAADDEEFLTDEARELGRRDDEENDLFDDEEADPFGLNRKVSYQRVNDVVIEKTKLKPGIRFVEVHTTQRDEPYTMGQAAMSFYPNGFQDQVMVVLEDESEARISLVTEPMTGRVLVFTDSDEVPEDFGEVERDD
jgi:type II secretory pathway pseudopilin PulG